MELPWIQWSMVLSLVLLIFLPNVRNNDYCLYFIVTTDISLIIISKNSSYMKLYKSFLNRRWIQKIAGSEQIISCV